MDALEKSFRAKGLDKTEPELFKKIVKYRKILESKKTSRLKIAILATCTGILLSAGFFMVRQYNKNNKTH